MLHAGGRYVVSKPYARIYCPTRTSAIAGNHGAARQTAQRRRMTPERPYARPILVTGAAGAVGSIGRNLTEMLLAKGHKVRALVRREDERAEAPRANSPSNDQDARFFKSQWNRRSI